MEHKLTDREDCEQAIETLRHSMEYHKFRLLDGTELRFALIDRDEESGRMVVVFQPVEPVWFDDDGNPIAP
jgi:hypothetical protein